MLINISLEEMLIACEGEFCFTIYFKNRTRPPIVGERIVCRNKGSRAGEGDDGNNSEDDKKIVAGAEEADEDTDDEGEGDGKNDKDKDAASERRAWRHEKLLSIEGKLRETKRIVTLINIAKKWLFVKPFFAFYC